MLLLSFLGLLHLYSASFLKEDFKLIFMQLTWISLGLGLSLTLSFIPLQIIYRLSYISYILLLLLVILVLFLGKIGMGAQRWLSLGPLRIQPSEFMKIGMILFLSRFFTDQDPEKDLDLKNFFISLFFVSFPALIIILQPDLGTAGLLFFIFLFFIIYKRFSKKFFIIFGFISLLSLFLLYAFGLKDYQRKRILNFLSPTQDIQGSGYNALQSKIAIGSGQFLGKGFKRSSQASLEFLPENHTDFIFALFNEERGFLGSFFLLSLYFFFILKALYLSQQAATFFNSLLCVGIASLFFWHVVINTSMCMGLFPVVGIPLPFFSYGGSSYLTFSLCTGILTAISKDRRLF